MGITAIADRVKRSLAVRANLPWQLQRRILKPRTRRQIAAYIASRLPAGEGVDFGDAGAVEELRRTGQLKMDAFLSGAETRKIVDALSGLRVRDRYRPELGPFEADRPPPSTHVADYDIEDLLRIPELLRIANDERIISIVSRYLGCKPTISIFLAWWSYPGHTQPEEAEYFHRDVDDWRFIKFFLYLTDVDEDSGPHCYIRGSATSPLLTEKVRRYTEEEVAEQFNASDLAKMTGKAGDAFLEDTFGLHKGQLCASKRRLIFQVQYSLGPVRIYEYDAKVPLPPGIDPYINRLYALPRLD